MSDGDKPRVGSEERLLVVDMLLSGESIRKVAAAPDVDRNKETVHRISQALTKKLLEGAKELDGSLKDMSPGVEGRRVSMLKRMVLAFLNNEERDELLYELLLGKSVKERRRSFRIKTFKVSKLSAE